MEHMKRPNIRFRVLIIGRANAGKTSILQRVCDTTESPEIYREDWWGQRQRVRLDPSTERGEHNIADELTFSNHDGYIFHDSNGIESGSKKELEVIQKFVREMSTKTRLGDRLHAIWYCIPMDNRRPTLDMKYFNDVCPDRNVPLIAVFTKYDQFKDNIEINLERAGCVNWETEAHAEAERVFQEHYLGKLGVTPHFVRLDSMHEAGKCCTELLEKTANALDDNVVSVMLLAVQKGNLELSIKLAVTRACRMFRSGEKDRRKIIGECVMAFPYMWFYNQKVSLLKSFVEKTTEFSLHYHDIHHIMIAVTLILEHATRLLSSGDIQDSALLQAQLQYIKFGLPHAQTQFPAAFQEYSDAEFIQFILKTCLLVPLM